MSEDAWIVYYQDASVDQVLFAGEGAEEAAWTHFNDARQHWSVVLFKEVDRS